MNDDIDQKTKIQILLSEHSSLRSETNGRISSAYIAAGWTTAAIIWLLQQSLGTTFWIGLAIWAIGTAFSGRILGYDAVNASRRVREIEQEINKRAGEKLLVWETERGGLNRDYWLRVFFLKR